MILLDTHALLWVKVDPAKLSPKAGEAIRSARQNEGLAISAMTLWELAWLAADGRLSFSGTAEDLLSRITSGIAIRHITPQIAILANQLPATYPSDPCDRLIGATAMAEGIALVTKDRVIRNCMQIKTIW